MKMLQWLLSTLVECLLLLLLLLCGLCLSLCNSGRVVSHELLISTCCLRGHVALGQEASSYTLCTLLGDQDSEFGMRTKSPSFSSNTGYWEKRSWARHSFIPRRAREPSSSGSKSGQPGACRW